MGMEMRDHLEVACYAASTHRLPPVLFTVVYMFHLSPEGGQGMHVMYHPAWLDELPAYHSHVLLTSS